MEEDGYEDAPPLVGVVGQIGEFRVRRKAAHATQLRQTRHLATEFKLNPQASKSINQHHDNSQLLGFTGVNIPKQDRILRQ